MLNSTLKSRWRLAVCAAASGLLALAAAGPAAAQGPTAAQQRFAAAYVAALQSNDPSQVTAIYHPATRACINPASQPYFDTVIDKAMQTAAEYGPHYRLTSFKPAGPAFMAGSDLFAYPVTPAYEMQIDARGGDNMHVKLWTSIVYLAPANGGWGVVLPCPTAKGMQLIRQQLASRQR